MVTRSRCRPAGCPENVEELRHKVNKAGHLTILTRLCFPTLSDVDRVPFLQCSMKQARHAQAAYP